MLEQRITAHMAASQGLSQDSSAAPLPSSHALSQSRSLPLPWNHGGQHQGLGSHVSWPRSERASAGRRQGSSPAALALPADQRFKGDGVRLLPQGLSASADLAVLTWASATSAAHTGHTLPPIQRESSVRSLEEGRPDEADMAMLAPMHVRHQPHQREAAAGERPIRTRCVCRS